MTTREERMQILNMVEKGHISSEEAARLLEALEGNGGRETAEEKRSAARWFRVRVTDMRTGKRKVNVNIPMGLVNVGMRMGAKFAPDMAGIDTEELLRAVKEGAQGKIIDVEDEEGGERVEVYVE
jgi:hypothetical protein